MRITRWGTRKPATVTQILMIRFSTHGNAVLEDYCADRESFDETILQLQCLFTGSLHPENTTLSDEQSSKDATEEVYCVPHKK